jgi:hypothetical protein
MLSCPHCGAPIDFRKIRHEGLFETRRTCPGCNQSFDLDARTKKRQAIIMVVLVLCFALTVLTYIYGAYWTALAVASYCLFGGILIYGNRRIYLVKSSRSDRG